MTLLTAHILTAILTLTVCTLSWLRPTPKLLAPLLVSSFFSLTTGLLVSLNHSLLATCAKLGVYSLVIAASLYKLQKSKKALTSSLL